jgi:glycine betaine/proline transport system ATP-binding protein
VQGVERRRREERARKVIELVGLTGRENSFPRELSGGQQQRVGIARSLAVEPEIWLLDEPFSALDPLIRRQMQDEFLRLQRLLNKTIVFITHDFLEALRLADRILIMKDGLVEQTGTPADVVMHPATGYVAEFTRDAPRGHVITLADILEPLAEDLPRCPEVGLRTTLQELMPYLAGNERGIGVCDGDGRVLGKVTPQGVIAALAARS